ncbi:8-oxoguanine deaminase [Tritonibacter multivorans]|uniref:8-oxoguanine deaminase n=1 Tax=Tritonibacter multivorans TaxID=928856 RepID=A0A0P1GB56_9RHOB|nr:formimidoylglutamate deiminase [Tritonibacter multivorans]MDA7422021.1 formimidoylglutamate deiminase [Tritonibacter multivorans]CUH78645.1 8-oxoguanine deaminase [Tritonibacter multivorans]SFD66726.1 formiminoglutamate deiminase [Tritonibacter multivorans]
MNIHATHLLVRQEWFKNCRVTCLDGRITAVEQGVDPAEGDYRVDTLLPALANLHSHSFQRAMAGMTEFRAAGKESFWTWRALMYRFLDHLTPEQFEAIAALVFLEMQEAGYAAVGEFHYVHHQSDGTPYGALSELSDRVFAAAAQTGIGLTHLPVLYTYAGVNQEALAGGQLRFSNSVDRFCDLVDACKGTLTQLPFDAQVGIAPHSLRATSPSDLAQVLAAHPTGPVHIHISEQLKEVADVQAKLGARPVDWLLNNAEVNDRWCLIHATHMTQAETVAMAQSGAVAGLCPITEANLGDGPFNGPTYLAQGGAFGVGSDSNVRISLSEELRTLEYSQRLRDFERNVMVATEGSVGQSLYTGAAAGGAQALNRDAGSIEVGKLADLVAIDTQHPALCALRTDQILDGLCFAASDDVVTDTWSAGRHVVKEGRHIARDTVLARYRSAISDLLDAI